MDTGQLHEAHRAQAAFQAISLDAPLSADPDASTRGDLLASEDTQLETCLGMDAVWAHLPELPPREQHLLAMRFYGNMTQSQIGHELGLSQMHVSRLLTHALSYLREQILGPDHAQRIPDPPEPLPDHLTDWAGGRPAAKRREVTARAASQPAKVRPGAHGCGRPVR
jgi:hypothetical protein